MDVNQRMSSGEFVKAAKIIKKIFTKMKSGLKQASGLIARMSPRQIKELKVLVCDQEPYVQRGLIDRLAIVGKEGVDPIFADLFDAETLRRSVVAIKESGFTADTVVPVYDEEADVEVKKTIRELTPVEAGLVIALPRNKKLDTDEYDEQVDVVIRTTIEQKDMKRIERHTRVGDNTPRKGQYQYRAIGFREEKGKLLMDAEIMPRLMNKKVTTHWRKITINVPIAVSEQLMDMLTAKVA